METYKITINEKDISGKHFLELMKTLPFISFEKYETKIMNELDEANAESFVGPFNSTEELKNYFHEHWDEF